MNKGDLEKQIELLVKDDERNQQTIIKQKEEIESLQQEIKELNDSVIWWTNRFNALQRDYEKWKWQKELLIKRDKEHQQKIEDLKEQLEYQDLWRKEYLSRIDKAIEYIENKVVSNGEVIDQLRKIEVRELLKILGSDKE